ncbi:rab11 family-interacting protein 1-like isoform X2 [Penaeus japonicus]|uniref:rab11 family-interacting protein 1-like isoform X2 n=1 Tax=Penaeus japonicus TaxID=27405 RepID=UPI001C71794F|nr:rab11 family-interacting protein 1-like isoform X2 [Penaeus japonicus]
MWQPTHVQVTVQRARNLLYKGKNETNDAFVVIALGKDKFQTSIKEKAVSNVDWHEECELAIPSHGNTAALKLTVFHRNALGLDEFLGQIELPLSEFDVYERPRNRWHRLKGKPEKDRKKGEKERGDLEVKVAFTVKSGSLLDVSNKTSKNKSITSLKNLGGSLMSLGSKEKASLKNFAKSVSHKIDKVAHKPGKKKNRKESRDNQGFPQELMQSRQHAGEADPGVISDSDDEGFGFDEEVTVNTRSSSPYSTISRGSSLLQESHEDEALRHNSHNLSIPETRPPPKPARLGGHVDVPIIAVEPMPPPSPQSSISSHSQEPSTPVPASNPPMMFPNLTPINLSSHNDSQSSRDSTSSDSAMTMSLTSSITTKDNSIPSLEPVSPETTPEPAPEPTPSLKEDQKPNVPRDPPSPEKPVRFKRSSSVTETTSPPSPASIKSEQSLAVPSPTKGRSLSTSAAPKVMERTVITPPAKEPSTPKGSALESLVSSASKVSLVERALVSPTTPPTLEKSGSSQNILEVKAPIEQNGFNVSAPPTPTSPRAFTFTLGSDSATPSSPATPKESSSGPTPATPTFQTFRGTPGLAERPSAAVVRSGSLHEKPNNQPVVDEWERKLYGRNAIVGSMENMNRSDSRSSLGNSRSSSTHDVTRGEEPGTRFPEIKALRLEKKSREDGDETEGKKRRGKVGGLKSKLFGGNSRERIGEEDGRFVEGGNDRLPHPPTHQSRLPQEIHDKFAGKSREDLLEMIVNLQASIEKNARHTRDLEDYIDGLLLRVMETTPNLLQAPINKAKKLNNNLTKKAKTEPGEAHTKKVFGRS